MDGRILVYGRVQGCMVHEAFFLRFKDQTCPLGVYLWDSLERVLVHGCIIAWNRSYHGIFTYDIYTQCLCRGLLLHAIEGRLFTLMI